ncbi:MAG: benzoyl-CoA reductase, bzd-type, subunit Q [Eubacterium sp.]|nr:benzoyl-CoA reductase, bzd-type, subunit Q [Eubacterium sp.]
MNRLMKKYGVWEESQKVFSEVDWKAAKEITVGIDVGTTSTEAVVMCDRKILCYSIIKTGMDFKNAAEKAINKAIEGLDIELKDVTKVVCTGFGHKNVAFASAYVDEIHCHGKGARYMFGPSVTTVIDMGGQTVKAVRLHSWDRVRDFMVNDKCATGMGHNIEELCELLQISLDKIGEKSLEVERDPEPVSTTCYAYAQTETMGMFHPGFREETTTENEVYAGHMFAIAWRILGVVGKLQPLEVGELAVYPELGLTGGLAKNPGIVKRLERELKITALTSEYDPMLAGAIGAALYALE